MTRAQRSTPPRRTRLAPAVRSEKILDSALAAFAQHGFAATRIEDIARGAGLAKSGFYAHFRSKEDVFETLLTRYLITSKVIPFEEDDSVTDFVDKFLDFWYPRQADPRRLASIRLLFVEAHRVPGLIGQWRREVADPVLAAQIEVLRTAVARGQLADDPILENFHFAYSPVLYWVLAHALLDPGEATAGKALDAQRTLHRQMMLAFLRAPGQIQEVACPANGSSSC